MKIGFIGCGNMATAILSRIAMHKLVASDNILCYDLNRETLLSAAERFSVQARESNSAVALESDLLFLAVKPQFYETVIDEIRDNIENQLIISLAAGRSIDWLEKHFFPNNQSDSVTKKIALLRTMPNTPALVGEGMTVLCPNRHVSKMQLEKVSEIFECCGKVEILPENLMNAVIAVSGSSPAYIFILIEAMADAAVAQGLPRKTAYQMAAQSVLGSAKMVLETSMHPSELKDMVCSPGGTTIEAVSVLEENGFRSAVIKAMSACADKAERMQKD